MYLLDSSPTRYWLETNSALPPTFRVKVGVYYAVTDVWKVGGNALFVSSQYLVGDESNQYTKLPSYTVFNLHTSYQVAKNIQLYGRVDNVFDKRYVT